MSEGGQGKGRGKRRNERSFPVKGLQGKWEKREGGFCVDRAWLTSPLVSPFFVAASQNDGGRVLLLPPLPSHIFN